MACWTTLQTALNDIFLKSNTDTSIKSVQIENGVVTYVLQDQGKPEYNISDILFVGFL